jgi:hypothetical protein
MISLTLSFGRMPNEQALGGLVAAVQAGHAGDFAGELDEQMLDHLRRDPAEAGDRRGKLLDLVGRELLPDRRAMILAQRQHQCGRTLRPGEALQFGRFGNRRHQAHGFPCGKMHLHAPARAQFTLL